MNRQLIIVIRRKGHIFINTVHTKENSIYKVRK